MGSSGYAESTVGTRLAEHQRDARPVGDNRSGHGGAARLCGPSTGTVWRGVEQGLREANTLGGFTGHSYTIQPVSPETLLATEGGPLPMAVLVATDAATLHRLSTKFATAGVAVLNLTADADELRQACQPILLHITPSAHPGLSTQRHGL